MPFTRSQLPEAAHLVPEQGGREGMAVSAHRRTTLMTGICSRTPPWVANSLVFVLELPALLGLYYGSDSPCAQSSFILLFFTSFISHKHLASQTPF